MHKQNNRVTISSEFFFKGKKLTPSTVIDCDEYLKKTDSLPNLYMLLARTNNIDTYSYEYEILLAEPLIYSNAEGLVASFIKDNQLDLVQFISAWKHEQLLKKLEHIALNVMGIDNLSHHPELKEALVQAANITVK